MTYVQRLAQTQTTEGLRNDLERGVLNAVNASKEWKDAWRKELEAREAMQEEKEKEGITKAKWIERYGGQALLDKEGFEVIPCVNCKDSICHGWKAVRREKENAKLL